MPSRALSTHEENGAGADLIQRIEKELGSRASVFFERLREVTDKCEHHVRLECRS